MSELQFCVEKGYFNDYIFLHLAKKLSDISLWGKVDILLIIFMSKSNPKMVQMS